MFWERNLDSWRWKNVHMSESEFDDGDKMYWCQIFFWITKTWLYIDDFFPCLHWFDHVVNFWGSAFDYIKDCTIIKHTINPMKIYQTNKWLFFLSFISSVLILLKMIEPKWFIELSRKKDDWMYNFSCSTLCDTSLLLMWKNIAYSLLHILVVVHMLDLYALASK